MPVYVCKCASSATLCGASLNSRLSVRSMYLLSLGNQAFCFGSLLALLRCERGYSNEETLIGFRYSLRCATSPRPKRGNPFSGVRLFRGSWIGRDHLREAPESGAWRRWLRL